MSLMTLDMDTKHDYFVKLNVYIYMDKIRTMNLRKINTIPIDKGSRKKNPYKSRKVNSRQK